MIVIGQLAVGGDGVEVGEATSVVTLVGSLNLNPSPIALKNATVVQCRSVESHEVNTW